MTKQPNRFTPKEFSPDDDQEDDGNQLVLNLTKNNKFVKFRVTGNDKTPGRDGFIELRDEETVIGKLEVQMKPIDSQRKEKKPCYQLDASLVGYSNRAGLPVVLICYDLNKQKAYWKRLGEDLFIGTKDTQQSVTVDFDPATDELADGFPYFETWKQMVFDHLEATREWPGLWENLSNDISLSSLKPDYVEGYQRFIDTLNGELDTEFCTVKTILHPWVWKFGICVYETNGKESSHRLYRIPKGRNGLLIIKTEKQKVDDWFENLKDAAKQPLGKYSKLFTARPLVDMYASNFLDRPEENAREFLFEEFRRVTKEEALPLFGELLCREQLFEFVDTFFPALGITPQKQIDLDDLLDRIENRLPVWLVQVVEKYNSLGFVIVNDKILRDHIRLAIESNFEPDLNIDSSSTKNQLTSAILNSPAVRLAIGSCRTLIRSGQKTIEDPYHRIGTAPIIVNKTVDKDKLAENIVTVLSNARTEYKAFVRGNGFNKLHSELFLNDDLAIAYFINLDEWIDSFEISANGIFATFDSPYFGCVIPNPNRSLPSVVVQFVDKLPEIEDKEVTIDGTKYGVQETWSSLSLKVFTTHPLRQRVYSMLEKDSSKSY